ncbi:MAG: hypothetical protein PWP76_689 [Candidatus Diapherotrites archaeon]|nr:hypothetical protein [Candidatus Diapherotrites archaeon]MDN5366996.1 hypothetical protein [Candidatus Diapherotrites archaeon]
MDTNGWVLSVWNFIYPGVVAFVIAIVGYILAVIAEAITRKVFKGLYYEEWFAAHGVDRAILGIHITDVISTLIKWWVFLGFFAQAITFLGMPLVTQMAVSLYNIYVSIALGIVYLSIGLIVATYVGIKMREAEMYGGELAIKAVQAIIIYFALVTALPYFGIKDTHILTKAIEIALWAVAIAFGVGLGIAIGLGGQDIVRDVLKKRKSHIEEILVGKKK